jgi:starvation-inducible outer membrane lipoprotein
MKPLKAKEQLTVLLPKKINYGFTIEEAEDQDFITEVIEQFAMMQAHNFLIWLANEQYQHIGLDDWSNGEQALNASGLYQKFIESDI